MTWTRSTTVRAATAVVVGVGLLGFLECALDVGEDKTGQPGMSRRSSVEVFDDGSGVQFVGGVEVRTFPAETFVTEVEL